MWDQSEKNIPRYDPFIYFKGKLSNWTSITSLPSGELSTLNIQAFAFIVAFCEKVHDNNAHVSAIC